MFEDSERHRKGNKLVVSCASIVQDLKVRKKEKEKKCHAHK